MRSMANCMPRVEEALDIPSRLPRAGGGDASRHLAWCRRGDEAFGSHLNYLLFLTPPLPPSSSPVGDFYIYIFSVLVMRMAPDGDFFNASYARMFMSRFSLMFLRVVCRLILYIFMVA